MNEQQVIDRLERAADTLPAPAATSLTAIQARAHARRRRRHVLTVAAAMPVVVLGGVVVAQMLPAGPQQPTIEPLGDGSEQVAPLELADGAVWHSTAVSDVADAAELFAEQALGWPDASVDLSTDDLGPVWITITGPEQRSVEGLFTPAARTREGSVWQLMQLGTDPGTERFEPWLLTFDPPTAAASADLYVRYEGQTWHLPLGEAQLRQREVRLADHGLPEGGQIEAVLIVYRDTAGVTLDAVGGHSGDGADAAEPAPFPADTALTERFVAEFNACMAEHNIVIDHVDAIVSSERALLFRGWSTSSPLTDNDPATDCENTAMSQLGLHPYTDSD